MDVSKLVQKATEAANVAGQEWMNKASVRFAVHDADLMTGKPVGPAIGYMLDVCGCAYVQFKDKRTAAYRAFKKAGAVRPTGNAVVEIPNKWMCRQEMGLHEACANAAKKVLEEGGVTGLRIWSWID